MIESRFARDERSREEPPAATRSAPQARSGSPDGPERSERVRPDPRPAIRIDWSRCDAHGLCHALLPGRIDVDEWGFPVIRDARVSGADEPAVRRTVAACPALALYLTSASSR